MGLSTPPRDLPSGDLQEVAGQQVESEDEQFPIERSSLFSRWCAEQACIRDLKWLESEKVGHDIGYHRAAWIWHTTHRQGWLTAMRASGIEGF